MGLTLCAVVGEEMNVPVAAKKRGAWIFLAALSLLLPITALAQVPQPEEGSSDSLAGIEAHPQENRPIFEFHSGFWVNLHHFLYEQARLRNQETISRGPGNDYPDPDSHAAMVASADLNSTADWNAAVNYYAKNLADRDLLFDGTMGLINDRLAELETCPDLSGKSSPECASGLRPDMIVALDRAAPFYRTHWWTAQDEQNRRWIEAEAPLVRGMGGALAERLAMVYHSKWQSTPIRVDVVSYGGPLGAYTTLDPTHITVSSTDARNQGFAGFEILFHEGSHALTASVEEGIVRDCKERDIPIPRDLWHALLFYTTGEMVKRALAAAPPQSTTATTSSTYVPYAYTNGLYERGWQDYQRVLETYWKPYLDGRTDFDHALADVVAHL